MGDAARTIAAYFQRVAGEGEFDAPGRSVPYSFIAPVTDTLPLVFTTKPQVLSAAIEAAPVPMEFGVIGRHGLPGEFDVLGIGQMLRSRGLCFLGDMDPVDLLVFCWLREHLPQGRVAYLGISDTLLGMLGITRIDSLTIPCAPSEHAALPVLREVFPDWEKTVGPRCAQILNHGQKFELEATLHTGQNLARVLQSALA